MSGIKLTVEAKKGNLAEVRKLVARGAEPVSGARYSERNVSIYSWLSGDSRIAKFVLDHGASADPIDATGRSALMIAAATGEDELVKPLLQSGAKLHLRDHAGVTARNWVSIEGREEIVELLSPQRAFETLSPDGSMGGRYARE